MVADRNASRPLSNIIRATRLTASLASLRAEALSVSNKNVIKLGAFAMRDVSKGHVDSQLPVLSGLLGFEYS